MLLGTSTCCWGQAGPSHRTPAGFQVTQAPITKHHHCLGEAGDKAADRTAQGSGKGAFRQLVGTCRRQNLQNEARLESIIGLPKKARNLSRVSNPQKGHASEMEGQPSTEENKNSHTPSLRSPDP